MKDIKRNFLVRFNRKTGKIDTCMNALGEALLMFWALQNTTAKTKDTIIFDEDGWVNIYYEGRGAERCPEVTRYEYGTKHIDEFCQGLLEAMKEEV